MAIDARPWVALITAALVGPIMVATALVAVVAPASAQPAPQPGAEEPPSDQEDPVWQLYDQAFRQLSAGDEIAARAALIELTVLYPDHPATPRAALRLQELEQRMRSGKAPGQRSERPDRSAPGDGTTAPPDNARPVDEARADGPGAADESTPGEGERRVPSRADNESTSQLARGQLALFMTGHGLLMALDFCRMLDCQSDRARTAALMLGGGAGLGISLFASADGIRPGHAQLLSSAVTWGWWNALMFNEGLSDDPDEAALAVAVQGLSLGAGLGLWRVWRPTSGQVALANSAGLWTSVLTFFILAADDDSSVRNTAIAVAGNAGLYLGGLLANNYPMSRGRSLLIDTGGVLGLLLGGLLAASNNDDSDTAGYLFGFAGTSLGLGLATVFSAGWDVPDPGPAQVALTPMGRGGWGASVRMNLDL
ncbi:MAG: hypothetical protein AAGC55_10120 [Myxococcota bacterium]